MPPSKNISSITSESKSMEDIIELMKNHEGIIQQMKDFKQMIEVATINQDTYEVEILQSRLKNSD